MKNYVCFRCGYTTTHKPNMRHHLKRKILCDPLLRDINLHQYGNKILDGLIFTDTTTSEKSSHFIPFHPKNIPFHPILSQNEKSEKIECEYCERTYKHNYHLNRHLKTCSSKKERVDADAKTIAMVNALNQRLSKQEEEIDNLKNKNIELVTNITNNTQHNTININLDKNRLSYGQTNYDAITGPEIQYALKRASGCLHFIVQFTHFNNKHPENQNVYVNCLKSAFVMVFNGERWDAHTWDTFAERFIGNNTDTLQEWICINGDQYPELVEKFDIFLNNNENDKFNKSLRNDIRLVLYNNREIIHSPAMVQYLHDLQIEDEK